MNSQKFLDTLHAYLAAHPAPVCTILGTLCHLMLAFITLVFAVSALALLLDKYVLPAFVSLVIALGVFYCAVPSEYSQDWVSKKFYPQYVATVTSDTLKQQMALLDRCHNSGCLMSPSVDNGLGKIPDESVWHFIDGLKNAYRGYQLVDGTDVLKEDKETMNAVSYYVKFLSVIMKEGHAVLFVELSRHGRSGIYEVSVYNALGNAYDEDGEKIEQAGRKAEFQNSIGR